MTGLVRKATLLAACGLVVAGAAAAGVPNAANSQKPCIILADFPNSNQFGGVNPGVCAVNALKVIERDALNNPVANSAVVLDFTTCAATFQLADTQADPAITTTCTVGPTVHQVMKTTNALGEVYFKRMLYGKAIDVLVEARRLGELFADDFFYLGSSYYKLNRFVPAEEQLLKAQSLAKYREGAYLQLYNVYMKTRQPEKALAQLDDYLKFFVADDTYRDVQKRAKLLRDTIKKAKARGGG